jgi:biotin carboxyl carrier protein
MRYYVTLPAGEEIAVDLVQRPGGRTDVLVEGQTVEVDAIDAEGAVNVRVGDRVFDLWLERCGTKVGFVGSGRRAVALVESDRSRIAAAASRPGARGGCRVIAPMPGRVVKLMVKEGDSVAAGAPVIVVEAMKMENELIAEAEGVVTQIHVSQGATVDSGALLVEVGPPPSDGLADDPKDP